MRTTLVQKQKQMIARKRRAIVLTFTLFLAIFVLSMTHLQPTDNRTKWDLTVPELNLHTVQDYYYDSHNGFFASYPFIGEPTFDDASKNLVKEAKDTLVEKASTHREANSYANLHVSYKLRYYNDTFISLSFLIQEAIDAKNHDTEKTILYDRKKKEVVDLKMVFNEKSDYLKALSGASRKALKTQLGDAYDEQRVQAITEPKEDNFKSFYISERRGLVVVFEPNTVTDAAFGAIAVPIPNDVLQAVIAPEYAQSLFALPTEKPKKEKKEKDPPAPAPTPATNMNPVPVPQADPSGVDCATAKCLALTFDDGPGGPTGAMLDILSANNAKATFFVLGQQAERNPGMVNRIHSNGHTIGNHTYDHQNLEQMSISDAKGQIGRTADIIQNITGIRPGIARAPYGAINNSLAQAIGVPFIGWSLDPEDWRIRDATHVCNTIVNNAQAGGIVLAHDIHATSVEGMKCAIPQLIQRGFTLVTVPQLLGFESTASATIYSSR